MRVLVIAFDTEEESVRLAGGLVGKVDAVYLMLRREALEPHLHLLDSAVELHAFPRKRLREAWAQLRLMRRLVTSIRDIDPDVIHFQKGHLWFNLTLPFLSRFPLVVSVHDPRHHLGDRSSRQTPQFINDLGYRRADRVIALNVAMKEMIERELRIPTDRIDVVPLIEIGHGSPPHNRQTQAPEVLFHGRIWAYKGLEHFIRAQPLVNAQVPEARFVIAGEGEDLTPYRAMMSDPDKFEVHNEFVSFEKREELVGRAAVVVLPYLEATQSGVIPVAYTHAKPVVATAVGGLPEQVDDGVTGFLVAPGDTAAIADRVIRLLQDPSLRKSMGEQGRIKLQREWSAGIVAEQTVPVYRKAIAAKQAGQPRSLRPRR